MNPVCEAFGRSIELKRSRTSNSSSCWRRGRRSSRVCCCGKAGTMGRIPRNRTHRRDQGLVDLHGRLSANLSAIQVLMTLSPDRSHILGETDTAPIASHNSEAICPRCNAQACDKRPWPSHTRVAHPSKARGWVTSGGLAIAGGRDCFTMTLLLLAGVGQQLRSGCLDSRTVCAH